MDGPFLLPRHGPGGCCSRLLSSCGAPSFASGPMRLSTHTTKGRVVDSGEVPAGIEWQGLCGSLFYEV